MSRHSFPKDLSQRNAYFGNGADFNCGQFHLNHHYPSNSDLSLNSKTSHRADVFRRHAAGIKDSKSIPLNAERYEEVFLAFHMELTRLCEAEPNFVHYLEEMVEEGKRFAVSVDQRVPEFTI